VVQRRVRVGDGLEVGIGPGHQRGTQGHGPGGGAHRTPRHLQRRRGGHGPGVVARRHRAQHVGGGQEALGLLVRRTRVALRDDPARRRLRLGSFVRRLEGREVGAGQGRGRAGPDRAGEGRRAAEVVLGPRHQADQRAEVVDPSGEHGGGHAHRDLRVEVAGFLEAPTRRLVAF
jgi:hypothetical protein